MTATTTAPHSPRLNYYKASPQGLKAMLDLEAYVKNCGLEHALIELVKMRASQLNGCAFCLDMHSKDARAAGETEQRLHVLPAWRETDLYTPRERAALEWTEALTLIADSHAPDAAYDAARALFNDKELA
ncbi:MAG: carboxymuconolactone decarboxylase family protein, partial [Alphaproteobacteria bacterium]|nr:carboxymuconolactone decarboxylase family protein [Alphaproteobacteria bacterium]